MTDNLNAKRTPGPWKFVPWHVEEGPPAVRAPAGWAICFTSSDANAAFIVRAANAHDALVEALKDATANLAGAVSAYETFAGKFGRKSVQDALFSTRLSDFNKALERARAALEKVL